ncbi:MAG: cell envelope biogenesis protein OmpA, partial [Rhizobiales bacterium]|nr:cell envelope biogenesis protein OmpA [Hyphomicrobiales bacterium]
MAWTSAAISAAGAVLATCSSAFAADLPVKAPMRAVIYNWTGFYLGGHVGYGAGSFGPNTNAEPLQGVFFPHSVTGLTGGFQAGYVRQLASKLVLGAEADISFGSPVDVPRLTPALFDSTIDYIATARGRIGYAMGPWMPYVTGGLAWGTTHVSLNGL